jgi:hypothetical protein
MKGCQAKRQRGPPSLFRQSENEEAPRYWLEGMSESVCECVRRWFPTVGDKEVDGQNSENQNSKSKIQNQPHRAELEAPIYR